MKELTAQLLEMQGVKSPAKIEAAIINVLVENNLTVAASQEILNSVGETVLKKSLVGTILHVRG